MSPHDADIIEAVKNGERERYGDLVERYQRLLYAIAWSRLGNTEQSEDVVQEAFLQGFRYLRALREPEKFSSWLSQITRNLCSHALRRDKRERERRRRWEIDLPATTVAAPGVPPEPSEREEALEEVLAQLPGRTREALVLFYLEGRSIRECAAQLGVREGAFKTKLHRARAMLRRQLEQRLETSLQNLRPSGELKRRVMTMLPMAPLSGKLTGGSITVALVKLFPILLQGGVMYGLLRWYSGRLSDNFRSERDVRGKILRRNLWGFLVTMMLFLVADRWFTKIYGTRATFGSLGAMMTVVTLLTLRSYRVNPTSFMRAKLIGNACMAMSFLAIALLNGFIMLFFAAMLFYGVLDWFARKDRPARQDYNLFLRAGMNKLGHAEDDEPALGSAGSMDIMHRLAHLMGTHFLINDVKWLDGGVRFYLPPLAARLIQMIVPLSGRWAGDSWAELAVSGRSRAWISPHDHERLAAVLHAPPDVEALARHVENTLSAAYGAVSRGDEAEALRLLEPQCDAEIYSVPPHKLRSMKVIYGLAIALCILLLLISGLGELFFSGNRFLWGPLPSSAFAPIPKPVVTIRPTSAPK